MNYAEWTAYINNPVNGLKKTRTINQIRLTAQFLPTDYFLYRESKFLQSASEAHLDSLKSSINKKLYFRFSIDLGDLTKNGENTSLGLNTPEYRAFLDQIHFRMKENFSLKIDTIERRPIFYETEPLISDNRQIYLVLYENIDLNNFENQNIEFIFDDPFYDTGLSYFNFKSNDLKNIPTLKRAEK